MQLEETTGQSEPAQAQQPPNSTTPTPSAEPMNPMNNTGIGGVRKKNISKIAASAIVLVVAIIGLLTYVGKSPNTSNVTVVTPTTVISKTTAAPTTTIKQSSGNPAFASLFQNGSANLTKFTGFIDQKMQSFNTFGVTYALTSNAEVSLSNSNVTYKEYFKNETIDTEAKTMGYNSIFNEYFFNDSSGIYICTNHSPFTNITCFTGPSSGISQDVKYADTLSALFGLFPPQQMNFVESGQGNVNGQQCTIVIGNENLSETLYGGSTFTEVAKLTTCLSNTYYAPLNFTYAINVDNSGFLYYNYTEKSIGLDVSNAQVTKLLTKVSS
jgi:hypothetical protein